MLHYLQSRYLKWLLTKKTDNHESTTVFLFIFIICGFMMGMCKLKATIIQLKGRKTKYIELRMDYVEIV